MQNDKSVCVCPTCEDVYIPVCGTDGLSYASNCYLRQAACRINQNIGVASEGACGSCFTFTQILYINSFFILILAPESVVIYIKFAVELNSNPGSAYVPVVSHGMIWYALQMNGQANAT